MACCPYCGSNMLLELEIWGHEWMPLFCCEALQAEYEKVDPYQLFQELTADAFDTRGLVDGLIDYKLDHRILQGGDDLRMAKEVILQHHRHHKPSLNWRFGVGIWNGPTLVGVAMVGRPVARAIPADQVVEVNRSCTIPLGGLERHAASKLYAVAAKEARRRGFCKMITYTFVDESGASLRGAGLVIEAKVKGRSWSCPSRPRQDKSEIKDKNRWAKSLK